MVFIASNLIGRDNFSSLSLNAVKSRIVGDRNVMRELYFPLGFVALGFGTGTFDCGVAASEVGPAGAVDSGGFMLGLRVTGIDKDRPATGIGFGASPWGILGSYGVAMLDVLKDKRGRLGNRRRR